MVYAAGGMVQIKPLGDTAAILKFGDRIDVETHRQIRACCDHLSRHAPPGLTEWVPTYTTLAVFYRPHLISYADVCRLLTNVANAAARIVSPPPETVTIPVVYGPPWGQDLAFVAKHNKLSVEEVVAIHLAATYLVYMLGFLPGFAYLGGMSSRIATPRLENPRRCLPAGSVGIAGEQTGIYPVDSPGGWRLIGRTPLRLYRPEQQPPVLLRAGQQVRFKAITREEYDALAEQEQRAASFATQDTEGTRQ